MKILGINTEYSNLEYKNFDEFSIKDKVSLFDYDAVIVSTENIAFNYDASYPSMYAGLKALSLDASVGIKSDFERLNKQLIDILKLGKRVYVLLGENPDCYIDTGEKQYSGTGKNRHTKNVVDKFNTMKFFPTNLSFEALIGEEMQLIDNVKYRDLLSCIIKHSQYYFYFESESDELSPLMKIKGTNKVVSAIIPYEKGELILLPHPLLSDFYCDETEWEKSANEILDAIFENEKNYYTNLELLTLPSWSNECLLPQEKKLNSELNRLEEELNALGNEVAKQKELIKEVEKFKLLFTSDGNALEEIVCEVLSKMGFTLLEKERGRTDIIALYNSKPIVFEVKGLKKSAAEKNSAQLEKWASNYLLDNEVQAKPILLINTWKEKKLSDRVSEDFPNQMLEYAKSRNQCLLTTLQLLCIYLEIKKTPPKAKEIILEVINTKGVYDKFRNYTDYIEIKNIEENPNV